MKDRNFKIAGLIILAVGGYFIYKRVKTNTTTGDADIIVSSGNSTNKSMLLTFDPLYVSAWANAVKANASTFAFGTKTYSTKGGKAIK
jgi:hypothetical protein